MRVDAEMFASWQDHRGRYLGREMLTRLGKQTSVCVSSRPTGGLVVFGGGGLGAEEQEVVLSQGPGSSRGFRSKCVDSEKEQKWEKMNPKSGRNNSDSPDKMNVRFAPPH